MGGLQVTGSTELGAANPLGISGSVHVVLRNAGQPAWIFTATAHGNLDTLR